MFDGKADRHVSTFPLAKIFSWRVPTSRNLRNSRVQGGGAYHVAISLSRMKHAGRRQAGQAEPRVFFATERTLPASVRTGRTIIALGCIMARFGLFLNLMAEVPDVQEAAAPHCAFSALGTIFLSSPVLRSSWALFIIICFMYVLFHQGIFPDWPFHGLPHCFL